ncbi:FadR/GntR family transcriptional regulator [Rhodococcus sp. NPDC059968]|uniref:FadR/GntR family transcriptional regulator n=1 Tax=Rhodococcus sp. NPDC059968 TaxID=3347017 RepID=UPI003670D184
MDLHVNKRSRSKVSDEIIAGIRSSIADGTYAHGERLPTEREFAEAYGVSQPTVREAIRALDAMGLVEVRHGSGAYVSGDLHGFLSTALDTYVQFGSVGLLDTLDVREVLGRYSARRAVQFATNEDVARIATCATACGEVANGGSPAAIAATIANFQEALAMASHNPLLYGVECYLIRLLIKLQLEGKREDAHSYWRSRALDFQEDRLQIARLLANRDEESTVTAMIAYLDDQRTIFSSDPDLRGVRLNVPKTAAADPALFTHS